MSTGPERKRLARISGEIRSPPFSTEARHEAGELLRRLQEGESLGMPHSRPMPSIGRGIHELRVRDAGHNWRIIYRVDGEAVIMVHVFDKRTRATPKSVIDLCKARLKAIDT